MKAVLCKTHGSPDTLVCEDVVDPELQPGQVRIGIKACGVNFPDVLMVAGKYQMQPPLPFSPGAELAGKVLEVASDVTQFQPGQRVLALSSFGGMAEQICVPQQVVIRIPDEMAFETAAAFLLAYGTSYYALKQRACLKPDETLLVLGAAGGVGLAAVELGKLLGARVIAAASSTEKLEIAREYGATELIDYKTTALKEQVTKLTGGKGVDVIYDPVGGELFDQCLRSVAWNSRILIIGFASGTIPMIPANLPLLKGASLVGVFWGRFAKEEPAGHMQNITELFDYYAKGDIRPKISATFALEDAPAAIAALAERRAIGKIVVTI
jgi:NADPH2:quinone reductase